MGKLTLQGLVQAICNTIIFSGNILFLILAAYIFSTALSFAGLGEQVTKFIVGLNLSKFEFYLALFALFTVLGCLIESLGMIVITVPLLYPVLASYDIDPILFGDHPRHLRRARPDFAADRHQSVRYPEHLGR